MESIYWQEVGKPMERTRRKCPARLGAKAKLERRITVRRRHMENFPSVHFQCVVFFVVCTGAVRGAVLVANSDATQAHWPFPMHMCDVSCIQGVAANRVFLVGCACYFCARAGYFVHSKLRRTSDHYPTPHHFFHAQAWRPLCQYPYYSIQNLTKIIRTLIIIIRVIFGRHM